ncbi:OprD family outer membrane porin [bacterium]|nr:OprD family outer membrane porin [bacterium]MBU1883521.1 OprD family outer membrane porin [bacterium]
MKLRKSATLLLLLSSAVFAHDIELNKDDNNRVESVREAISNIGETEEKNVSSTEIFNDMFKNGKVTGQIRAMYAGYDYKNDTDTHATSLGGQLKYELAELNGFNAGVAFYTANDINFATGDGLKQNNELSSSNGHYTDATEAYINYKNDGFNFRAGRQVIDTPLADSDDIRMIPNTFQAYIASFTTNGLSFLAGNLQEWQGSDAGLDDGWQKTGTDGTWLASIAFENDNLNASFWYYNITKELNAYYADGSFNYEINQDGSLELSAQALIEKELNGSTNEANIYGAAAEAVFYGFGVNVAYNKAIVAKGKQTFSGFGGGTLYTNMDPMILDNIAIDRDADAIAGGISYVFNDLNLFYTYGVFRGEKDSTGQKAYVRLQDIGFEYDVSENFRVSALYAMQEDKELPSDQSTNFNRLQIMAAYNF